MKRIVVYITLMVLCSASSNKLLAQDYFFGKVVDEQHKGLPFVTVMSLAPSDSTLIETAVTDSLGTFKMAATEAHLILRYSLLGYETLIQEVTVDSTGSVPVAQLKADAVMMSEVEVSRKSKTFILSGNKLIVDVEHDELLSNQSNLSDVLGKIPGIIQKGNNISVAGKGGVTYYIDGRKALDYSEVEKLSVDRIKSIKVVNGTSVEYSPGNNAVIDIRTKRLGDSIALNAVGGAGIGDSFSWKAGADMGCNYKNWDFDMAYSYDKDKRNIEDISETAVGRIWDISENSKTKNDIGKHNYKAGFTYHFSPDTHLGLSYSGSYHWVDRDKAGSLTARQENKPENLVLYSDNAEKEYVHHVNIFFKTKLRKEWNLSAYGDYYSKSDRNRTAIEEIEDNAKCIAHNFSQSSRWKGLAMAVKADRMFPNGSGFSAGYEFSFTKGHETIDYVASSTNGNAESKETRNSLFATYDIPVGLFSVNLGLRYDFFHSNILDKLKGQENRQNKHFLLPSIGINYARGQLMQSLNCSIEGQQPFFTDMNNSMAYSNRYSSAVGNLNLKTEIDYNINYMLMYKSVFLNLSYTYAHNPILSSFYSDEQAPSVVVGKVDNFRSRHLLNCVLSLRHTFGIFTPSLTMVCMKSFFSYPGPDGVTLSDKRPIVMATLGADYMLPKNYHISAKYLYNAGGDYQMVRIGKEASLDISVKKTWARGRFSVAVDMKDIFNKLHTTGLFRINNISVFHHGREQTRFFGITATYKFREKKESKSVSAASKEMSRLKIVHDEN